MIFIPIEVGKPTLIFRCVSGLLHSIFRTVWHSRLVLTTPRVVCLTCGQTRRLPCTHTTTSSAAFRQSPSRAAAACCSAATTTSTVISGTLSSRTAPVRCLSADCSDAEMLPLIVCKYGLLYLVAFAIAVLRVQLHFVDCFNKRKKKTLRCMMNRAYHKSEPAVGPRLRWASLRLDSALSKGHSR